MIPKIIHIFWDDLENIPYITQKCIENIKRQNPNFIVKLYDKKFIMDKLKIRNDTYEAFVSDIFRLYILYKTGGIYLDASIILLKKIDCVFDLNDNRLQGYETPWGGYNIENYCMCCSKNNKVVKYWLKECLIANRIGFKNYVKFFGIYSSNGLKKMLPYLTNFVAYSVACNKLFGGNLKENKFLKLLQKSNQKNGPLYYLKINNKNSKRAVQYLLNSKKLINQNCIIKLRGSERELMDKMIIKKKYNKNALVIQELLFVK